MTLLGRLSPVVFSFVFAVAVSAQSPVQKAPLDRANLDTTCSACDDFYEFANGGWLSRAKIPAAYPEFGAFQELYDRNEATLHDILETSAKNVKSGQAKPGTGEWKVGAYYATCMDTAAIERRGAAPIKEDLDRIAAINTREDLKRSLGELERLDGLAPWGDGSAQDARDAANTIAGLYQGGLTLPNNEYYTKTDTASVSMRRKFVQHVTRMFELLGDAPATAA
ncbi:MAG TPA: M13 family metallopeptidase N-terminal domain-containing protein, partial [Gemmatimonadaceae bacterium]|nr:M13 family metallopeptidase N-terminal domain-containing protein [Gemmatimonadaceae bacterium]